MKGAIRLLGGFEAVSHQPPNEKLPMSTTTTVELVNAPATPLPQLSASTSVTSQSLNQTTIVPAIGQNGDLSKGKTMVVISSVTCITGISSLLAGIVTVCIPAMARDVRLDGNLLLW